MLSTVKQTALELNHLIHICRDGEEGFRLASETVEDLQLKVLFAEYARQRGDFAQQLQDEVVRLGEEPTSDGTIRGTVHRSWIQLQDSVLGHDEATVVSECERGEEAAVNAYEEALESDWLTPACQMVVSRQFVTVRATHDHLHELEKVRSHVHH